MGIVKFIFGVIILFMGLFFLIRAIIKTWGEQGKYRDPLQSHMHAHGYFGFGFLIIWGVYLIFSSFS